MTNLKKIIIERDKKCFICKSKKKLEVHHIIPTAQNGTNDYNNLITLCSKCHRENHNILVIKYSELFLEYTSLFDKPRNWDLLKIKEPTYKKKEYRLNVNTVDNLSKLKNKTGLTYNKLFLELIKTYNMLGNGLTKEQKEKLRELVKVKEGDVCPYCKIGIIKIKHSKFGEFLGCDEFPRCAFTQKL